MSGLKEELNRQLITTWWSTGEVQRAIRKKKATFRIWLYRKDDHFRCRYVEARRTSKLAVKAAKERSWQEFGERLKLDYRPANKTFWQTTRRIRGKKIGGVRQVMSKNGTLLSDEESILCRWREYFSELLNPVRGTEGGRSEASVGAENSLSVDEVALANK